MIQVTFDVGYPAVEFEFAALELNVKQFMDTALTTYTEERKKFIKLKYIKNVPEGGNPTMAHNK